MSRRVRGGGGDFHRCKPQRVVVEEYHQWLVDHNDTLEAVVVMG